MNSLFKSQVEELGAEKVIENYLAHLGMRKTTNLREKLLGEISGIFELCGIHTNVWNGDTINFGECYFYEGNKKFEISVEDVFKAMPDKSGSLSRMGFLIVFYWGWYRFEFTSLPIFEWFLKMYKHSKDFLIENLVDGNSYTVSKNGFIRSEITPTMTHELYANKQNKKSARS